MRVAALQVSARTCSITFHTRNRTYLYFCATVRFSFANPSVGLIFKARGRVVIYCNQGQTAGESCGIIRISVEWPG